MTEAENVVLITIDSLRRDFVGCYDERGARLTPNMDEFAEKGVLFEDAVAQGSYTRASVPSFFTSTYPWKIESGGDISGRDTLGTILKEHGYNTACFHSNPFLSEALGYARGFDVFDDSLLPWNLNLSQERTRQLGKVFRILRKKPYLPAERLVSKARKWLEGVTEPYFLWLHLMDPHGPYQSQDGGYLAKFRAEKLWQKAVNDPAEVSEEGRERMIKSYRSEVEYTDRQVGRLLDFLSERKSGNVVVITADHGEEFGEHGDYSHNPKPYEELIRVPFLLDVPGVGSKRINEQVALLDLLPGIMDILGMEERNYEFDGLSFAPFLKGEGWGGRDQVICQPGRDLICLRTRRWKYVVEDGSRRLYDLMNDPEETSDLSETRTDLVEEFEQVLAEKKSEYGASEEFTGKGLGGKKDEERKQRLEDLGYL